MIYRKKTRSWGCMLTAFSMASGISESDLLRGIGHDGGARINSELPPRCYRGFHIQEFIEALLREGIAVVQISTKPILEGVGALDVDIDHHLRSSLGVVYGQRKNARHKHALANNYGVLIDPDTGFEYEGPFEIEYYWRVEEIQ